MMPPTFAPQCAALGCAFQQVEPAHLANMSPAAWATLARRLPLLLSLHRERERQEGEEVIRARDGQHTTGDWYQLIVEYLGRACQRHTAPVDYRRHLIQVAALCLAAIEAHDRQAAKASGNDEDGER